ncbi:E3 ubiquitin-protein like [Actinidia chinensis var. chinensis]|uniref:RING-type E3 ubiquitin transferase n=1 Tax=Actinidia chinensis var. chinensis TaxID=1590841 RepID=A0A2R6Q2C8_ACTCC|nr:E3 ubiquitin-protein like [Actinidia chinensis var. chinensis]
MDGYSGKRTVGGLVIPKKGSSLISRDAAENKDRNAQFCNRLGCNGRLNHTKSAPKNGCSEKFNSSRPFHASSGKEIIGSSARTCSVATNTRKSFRQLRKKLPSKLESDSSETSSVQDEPEVGNLRLVEVGSSNVPSNSRSWKVFHDKSGIGTRDIPLGSSVPFASKSSCQEARNSGSTSRYGLRSLRYNSTSDNFPSSGGSSSESNVSRRKDIVKKRNLMVESGSSIRGKKMSGPMSDDSHSSTSMQGISISDSGHPRNWFSRRNNGVGSDRTRKSTSGTETRLSNQGNGKSLLQTELPVVTQQLSEPELNVVVDVPGSSNQFTAEASSSHSSSFSRSSSSDGSLPGVMQNRPIEFGITSSLMNRDGLRRFNMDGIAEVLLELDRIEQDEELTYEQVLDLETNLFLGGLGFYDEHRDMRLDIDDMSYEELLALEDKMGTVSTAVPEEALSNCLTRSIFQLAPPEGAMRCNEDEDDDTCSICQEEYVLGDEVGRLECGHGYHVICVQQWLQLKNLCPICKASAATSQSP